MPPLSPSASPAELRTALEENLWTLWARFGRSEGCALVDTPSLLRFDTPITRLPYNAVLRFRPESTDDRAVDEEIDAIFAHYRERGVPFFWLLHPSARPSDLPKRLEARGMLLAEQIPGMVAPLADLPDPAPPAEGVSIHEAGPEEMQHIVDLAAWRWDLPVDMRPAFDEISTTFDVGQPGSGLRCWIAKRDGVFVSKAFIVQSAGVAGLYAVVTRPEARGLGLARTLTLLGFQAARAEGYEMGVLHSSAMALGLYEKLGFRRVEPFSIYAPTDFHV